jgi:hypothetical protein
LAIEQPTPDVSFPNRIELEAPTEVELCSRGAVKLTHIQFTELKMACAAIQGELRAERQRNDAVTTRMNSIQTDYQVLRASLQSTKYREIIVRIIELCILALLAYALDFEKSGDTKDFAVFLVICIVLVLVIALIQWTPRPRESK